MKVLHSVCQQIWKIQLWPQDWKMSILIPVPKKDSSKECSNHQTIALISYACKDYVENLSSQALAVHEPRPFRCSDWVQKRQRNQKSNCQHLLDHRESKRIPKKKKNYLCLIDWNKAVDSVDHNKLWKTLKEMRILYHLTCLLRNPYAGQEVTLRILVWNNGLVQN